MRHYSQFVFLALVGLLACVPAAAHATTLDVGTDTAANWSVTGAGATNATAQQYGGAISISSNNLGSGTFITGGSNGNFDGYWIATQTFVLPADATGVSFVFSKLKSDDRVVLKLNGTILGDYFASDNTLADPPLTGSGNFSFTDGTPPPETTYAYTGVVAGTITSGFNLGSTNTLTLIVNNADVAGDPDNHLLNLTVPFVDAGDGTFAALTATVSYAEVGAGAPLPKSAWLGLTLLSALALGTAARRRLA